MFTQLQLKTENFVCVLAVHLQNNRFGGLKMQAFENVQDTFMTVNL